ncbi:hypothetical protein BC832DRAFT_590488 [Gaertneriomyces semiglobifer]|nr:hypothetical protein BC832DRAFT_590488 [Gaertneriomyces semiglobifer]
MDGTERNGQSGIEPSSNGPGMKSDEELGVGVSTWERRRAEWTRGHQPYAATASLSSTDRFKNNPSLAEVNVSHYDAIYRSLMEGRRFANPVPLPFVVAVLINGWKREGLWDPSTGIGSNLGGPPPGPWNGVR